jgi:hypothetical protein
LAGFLNKSADQLDFLTDWQIALGFSPSWHTTVMDRSEFHRKWKGEGRNGLGLGGDFEGHWRAEW